MARKSPWVGTAKGTPGGTCCVPASLLANPTHSRMIAPANCTALGFQAGRERLTPQSILLFETECHEPDRSRERLARGGAKPLQGGPRAHSHYHPRPVTQTRYRSGPRSGAGATLLLVLASPDTWLPPHCDRPCPTHSRAGRWWSTRTWKTAWPDSAPPSEAREDSSQDAARRRGP